MQSIARDYWTIWKQFVLHGVTQEDVLPPALMQSWRRCASSGLDPYGEIAQESPEAYAAPGVSQHLLSLVRPVMEDLHQFVEGSECVVVFADANVRIIDCFGDREIQEELEHLGLHRGAS
jgi:transcriptional regulator of acetoin/glycerol metabolism